VAPRARPMGGLGTTIAHRGVHVGGVRLGSEKQIPGFDPGLCFSPPSEGVECRRDSTPSPDPPLAVGRLANRAPPKEIIKLTSVNDCESIPSRGCWLPMVRRAIGDQKPREGYGGGGARDRTGPAMVPYGTKASPGRPRPHPPLPRCSPRTNETTGGGEHLGGYP
jgi:hypothetical protein